MSQFHFISGLPRSGSTLLSAILRQNPRYHASMMSPVFSLAQGMISSWSAGKEIAPLVSHEQKRRLVRGVFEQFHGNEHDVVFDSNRGWAEKLPLLVDLFPEARVICCVRNIAWTLDSFEKLYQQNPYEQTRLFPGDDERSTVYTRVRALARPNRVVGYSAQALREAFYSPHSNRLILLDYEYLVRKPQEAIAKLYQELGEPRFAHDFDNVGFDAPEFDANLGVPGLHSVRGKVEHRPRKSILPPDLFNEFAHLDFWYNSQGTHSRFITESKKQATTTTPLSVATPTSNQAFLAETEPDNTDTNTANY